MAIDDIDFDALIAHIHHNHITGYITWGSIDKALRAQKKRKGIRIPEIKSVLVNLGIAYKINKNYAGICLKWTEKGKEHVKSLFLCHATKAQ